MGRFDAFSSLIRMAMEAVGLSPRPWMLPAAVLAVLILLGPTILRNIHTGQARKRVGRLSMLEAVEREAQTRAILDLVHDNPVGTVAIAEEAIRRGQLRLARLALQRLEQSGARPADQHRLREELDGPLPRNADLERVVIEQMIDSGAHERARARLGRARQAFPADPVLAALARRLEGEAENPSA
jgi:hypothetical protein